MFKDVFSKPRFRAAVNVGALMDIPTGIYEPGKNGEMILNGGLASFTGICARPNNFKTALSLYLIAMLRRSCHGSATITYDTEGTLHPTDRLARQASVDPYLDTIDFENDELFSFTDLTQYSGDDWFKVFRTKVGEKPKAEKEFLKKTPFVNTKGENKFALYPTGALIDSFSKFTVNAVETIWDKNLLGEGGANVDAMTGAKAKSQMMNQLPMITAKTGTYLIMTAHLGDVIQMEMYPTDKRNLKFLPKDTALKGVSNGFYSLPNNVWYIASTRPLFNKEKLPEYPMDNSTAFKGDTDLIALQLVNLRGKLGPSGIPTTILVSQSGGILPALTEFHYCKENDRWGIGGNLQTYFMHLRPDVSLSRTKVRSKLDSDPLLCRAMQFTAEMYQIYQYYRDLDPKYNCTPEQLYTDLKAMGYDWEILLNTRGYWVFDEETSEHPLNFLSTMDLLRMRVGEYIPYWLEDKSKIKPLKNAENKD